ncbi:EF-hand domain pair [Phytophthora cactorum]|nr:EF-hand domain pair [Phytophthora cactorum]
MSYQVSSVFLQKFSPKEIHELKRVFKEHDRDYAAAVPVSELHTVLQKLGENVTPNQTTVMLQQTKLARPEQISFQEFLELIHDFRNGAIALDPALLMGHASVAPTPVQTPVPATSEPTATVETTPFFASQKTVNQTPEPTPQAPAFAQKAQWPPTGTPTTPTAAPAPVASNPKTCSSDCGTYTCKVPLASYWFQRIEAAVASCCVVYTATPPAAAPPAANAKWPPVGDKSPKPQWPPAGTSPSAAKPQWPPTSSPVESAPKSPVSSKPPKSPVSSKPPQWPPAGNGAAKPQWPPSASSSSPSEAPKRAQWPPAASTPPPAPVVRTPPRSPVKNTAPVSPAKEYVGGVDAHTLSVLQRRASAAAQYNSTIHEVKGTAGGLHSYSEEETAAFTEHINNTLQADKDVASLMPIGMDAGLFLAVGTAWYCRAKELNVYQKTENQNLCINAAKSIGCSVVNIGPDDLIEGKPILVLGLVWQIIKIQLTSTINLKNHPELMRLLLDGETLEEFMKLPPDQILLRWMNYHLKAAGHPKKVTNFSSDVQDATAASVPYVDQSLAIDDVYINHLYSDLSDGMKLLKVLDKIQKGIVAWNKVNMVAPNKFKQVENCNYCVVLGKQLKFSLVNVGGADIFEGAKKMILSIVWQSMRYQQLKILSELAAGRGEITDKDIIGWANNKVRQSGQAKGNIVSFRDPTLSDGLYLLDLVHAVEPRAVNWDMVLQDKTEDAKASNAKYAISCAQKIGATVFLTYEDIVEVKPKMMMTFVATSISGSGSASASSLSSASGDSDSTAINTTDIVSVCTAEDVTFINDLNMEVSKNADCLGSAGAATEAISKAAYCAEDACVAYMTNVEARLPNCSYSGYNIKQVVADALACAVITLGTDSSITSKTELCESACTKLMRELLPDTPDCENDGGNLGEIYGDLVTWCDASNSGSSLSSATRDSKWTADTTPTCTVEEVAVINDINTEGEKGENCRGNVSANIITEVAFCGDPTCVAYLANVEARLPNCSYEGISVKQVVGDTVALCDDAVVMLPNSTTPTATTTTLVPTTTTQTPVASSADSQATDTPAATKSAAVALGFSGNVVTVNALTLTVVLAWVSL